MVIGIEDSEPLKTLDELVKPALEEFAADGTEGP